jgi:GST-like protein
MTYELYGTAGAGSAIVEAMLTLAGVAYDMVEAAPWEEGPHLARLRALNPLVQVPTLVLPDGAVLTESAAIALYLAERYPGAGLAPAPQDAERARFLRWLVFLVADVYATFTIGDEPSRWVEGEAAQSALRRSTDEYRKKLWITLERESQAAPWFLGARFSALDAFIAVMVHWRPRRAWFSEHCPKLDAIARQVARRPELAGIWARNFPSS